MEKAKKRRKAKKRVYKKVIKKPAKKPKVKRKKSTKRKVSKKPIWETHVKHMEQKVNVVLSKLKKDIKRKAPYSVIEKDNNELLMLLGECNYIVREFHEKHLGKK